MTGPGKSMAGKRPLRVLIVEDREDDLLLLLRELDKGGYAVSHTRAETIDAFRAALTSELEWQIVISDFSLPTMTALDVLNALHSANPDLPCIVISGTIAEEAAVDVLRAGARDFVVKDRMARLIPAIERELREAAERRRRREAEANLEDIRARMQFVLEAVGIGLWEWDVRSGRMTWSDVQERLHGLEPGTFAGSIDAFIASVHPDDRRILLRDQQEMERGGRDLRIEYRTVWPDGSVHWITGIGQVLSDKWGAVRSVGVGMEVTAQKRLEEQFHQSQKMESIGNLAGGIAHDFNNLLTVISACCEMAAERVSSDREASESLEGIRSATDSATALTRQLLTFSRRQIVTPQLLDLNETIAGFGQVLRRLVEENVRIEFRLAVGLPPVRVDPRQIEQVMLNLVANARDAMPDGGTVTIETARVTREADDNASDANLPPGEYIRLLVGDTGVGMPAEVRAHLFEPFFTTKPQGQGTGLGLATVYGIVTQSGGHIFVESEPESGTAFKIYLPVASTSSDIRSLEETSGPLDLTGRETILVVEDNAPLRRLIARMLRHYGYTVLIADSGAQAEHISAEHDGPIHIVLIDVIMPGDSGPVVAERICRERPATKIIYMSGYPGDPTKHGGLGAGSAFLQKPFDTKRLARTVREALSSRSSTGPI